MVAGKLEKTCSRCKETKVLALFNKHPHAKGRRRPECAECTKSYHRKRRRTRSADEDRKHALKKNYGISLADYQSMHEAQDGKCAICGASSDKLNRFMAVDHCHKTGKLRSLLCSGCNTGLGFFKDSPALLTAAIQYILSHEEE